MLAFALRTLSVRPAGAAPLGYDLDQQCTASDTDPAQLPCTGGGSTSAADDDGGVDNGFGKVVDIFTGSVGDPDAAGDDPAAKPINNDVRRGLRTLFLFLGGYNGEANDDKVVLTILPTSQLLASGHTCEAEAGIVDGGPLWNGCDVWSHRPGAVFVSGTKNPIADLDGYVADGTLVIKTGGKSLDLDFGDGHLVVQEATLTAQLAQQTVDGGMMKWVMSNGVFAGRGSMPATRSGLLQFRVMDSPVCLDDGTSAAALTSLCRARDIPLSAKTDGGVCDAISMGFGFAAESAVVGTEGSAARDAGCPAIEPACP